MQNVDKRRATSNSNGDERMNESEGEKVTAWVEGDEGIAVHNNPISDALGLRLWPVISSRFPRAIGLVKIMTNLAPGTELRHSRGRRVAKNFVPSQPDFSESLLLQDANDQQVTIQLAIAHKGVVRLGAFSQPLINIGQESSFARQTRSIFTLGIEARVVVFGQFPQFRYRCYHDC